jgi:hypothetical protein
MSQVKEKELNASLRSVKIVRDKLKPELDAARAFRQEPVTWHLTNSVQERGPVLLIGAEACS